MIIKRPMTEAQKEAVQSRDLPSDAAQLQAMKDFIDYAAIKLKDLEDKVNGNLPAVQSRVDYTC
ncbi:MAG: hypothetical protein IJG33_13500 [Selenomonadaceae bacterium]|nr:hypothetical protein [Selenomonadaceae bacterium]